MKLTALLCFASLFETIQSFEHTLLVPKAFRIGALEKVILNLHGYQQATVTAYLQDLPDRRNTFSRTNETSVGPDRINECLELFMKVSSFQIESFRRRQKVVLVLQVTNSNGGDFRKEQEVLVSKESGYLFVITDRPIYKPEDIVAIKVFPLDQTMRPNRDTRITATVKNADGIGVWRRTLLLRQTDQFVEAEFYIEEQPELGKWFVEVKYSSPGYKTSAQAEFVVQRYVLPTFQVSIELEKNFILSYDTAVRGKIKARTTYEKLVDGNYFVSAKLKKSSDSAPIEFYRRPATTIELSLNGETNFDIPLNVLETEHNENLTSLSGKGAIVFIEVSVTDRSNGMTQSTVSSDLPLLLSPYIIDIRKTSKYYTPRLLYNLRADVVFAVGRKPAADVPVAIYHKGTSQPHLTTSDENGQVNFLLAFEGAANQNIRVVSRGPGVQEATQTQASLAVKPYQSSSNKFLQVSTNLQASVGKILQITFSFSSPTPREIRYVVLARGSILLSGVNNPLGGNLQSVEKIQVVQSMVPSARIVAYYLADTEVVSNSFWFDVKQQCKEDFTVHMPEEMYPGDRIDIRVKSSSNALVSVKGVDSAAYSLQKSTRLTQQEVFDAMVKYDQGCGRQGGADSVGVFWESGLVVSTKQVSPRPAADSLDCSDGEGHSRRKREAGDVVEDIDLDEMHQCEMHGWQKADLSNDTCVNLAEQAAKNDNFMTENCHEAFIVACRTARDERLQWITRRRFKRSGEASEARIALARLRTNFQEVLLFRTMRLDNNGQGTFALRSRDSITTFEIDAVSMQDSADGFCVAQPKKMRVSKQVFIQLLTPYALKRLEQENVKITIFNQDKNNEYNLALEVRIEGSSTSESTPDLCTRFNAGEWSKVASFTLHRQGSFSTHISVLPLRVPLSGYSYLYVRIVTADRRILDQIRKQILIEDSGHVKRIYASYPIDVKIGRRQNFAANFNFPDNYVLGSTACKIYAYAAVIGPNIAIDPITQDVTDIQRLIRRAYGAGETVVIRSGLNVYALAYLHLVGTLIPNTPAYADSINKIQAGYRRLLSWRSDKVGKRAFAMYSTIAPSTWLNAFADKVFIRAREFVSDLDVGHFCNSLDWLLTQQDSDGHFQQERPPYHINMHGAVGGPLTLTAYVVISMLETQGRCRPELNRRIGAAVQRSIRYLEANVNSTTFRDKPYAMALLSYTFALNNPASPSTREIFNKLLQHSVVERGKIHWNPRPLNEIAGTDIHNYWYRSRPLTISVEATAYALLAQMAMVRVQNPPQQRDLDRARKIVLWLIMQQNEGRAFVSAQDTIIGLQALYSYRKWISVLNQTDHIDINLRLSSPTGTDWNNPAYNIRLDNNNQEFRSVVEVPANVRDRGIVGVTATGTGKGVLSFRCNYRTIDVDEEECHYPLDHNVTILDVENVDSLTFRLSLSVSKMHGFDAGKTVVEVGILPGFIADERSVFRTISLLNEAVERYETTSVSIIIYLKTITVNPVKFSFDMEQTIPVQSHQSAKVNVYDFYEPSTKCSFFYALPRDTANIRTFGCENEDISDSSCMCAEGGCLTCRTREAQFSSTRCLHKEDQESCSICDHNVASCENIFSRSCRRSYTFIANITAVLPPEDGSSFYRLRAKILEVWKYASDYRLSRNTEKSFVVRADCFERCRDETVADSRRETLNAFFLPSSQFLIIGETETEQRSTDGDIHTVYHLDSHAFVERYIDEERCTSAGERFRRSKLRCADPHFSRRVSQQRKCDKWKKILDACRNWQEVKRECD